MKFGDITDIKAYHEEIINIPVTVTTDSIIEFAQFVIEYDSLIMQLVDVKKGDAIPNFSMITNMNLPFEASTARTNKNFLVQLCGTESLNFSGSGVIIPQFKLFMTIGLIF